MVSAAALEGLPEIRHGDDVAELIAEALQDDPGPLADGDVVVIAHKVISKAEGRVRALAEVDPTARAIELAAELDKDPRHVQVILDECTEVLRAARGVLICVTRHGFVCANAGVDASNVPGNGALLLLPEDPDASASAIRARLEQLTGRTAGVLITDSFGRAWRHGQVDVAIGSAGLAPLEDWRGLPDATGREMTATWIGVADELAGAADLARTKDGAQPVVLVHGAHRHVVADDGPGAEALIRASDEDLFR